MMTYIKSKYGIIKLKDYVLDEETDINYRFKRQLKSGIEKIKIFPKKVVGAISDNLEELCDLFVDTTGLDGIADGWRFDGYDKIKKVLWYITTGEDTRYIPISEWEDKTVIYGAIWTPKGLIYVAKMNEKGTLELL